MKRSSDLQFLPDARPSPFDKLATETIAQIFDSACPSVELPIRRPSLSKVYRPLGPDVTDPWLLSIVCKRWRDIASYHSLWTTIAIEFSRLRQRAWRRWGLSELRDCLNRSGSQPLKIHISSGGIQYDPTEPAVVIDIVDVVMAYSERWKSITFIFSLSRELLQKFNSLVGRLPMLEHLEIHLSILQFLGDINTPSICTAFLSAPALRRVGIIPFPGMTTMLRNMQIPWTQISEVTFSIYKFYCTSDLHKILTLSSNSLAALTFSDTLHSFGPLQIRTPPKPIKLAKLRRLSFFEDCTGILDMLSCPSLKELHIETGNEIEITRFLDNSLLALTNIHLGNITGPDRFSDQDYAPLVLMNTSLSTLQSISLTVRETVGTLNLLIFGSQHLVPSLETLRIYSKLTRSDNGKRYLSSQVDTLRNIVQSRMYAIPSNIPESSMDSDALQSNCNTNMAEHPLKNCSFTFMLEVDGSEVDDYWDTTPLEELRSFCIARNTRVLLEIIYSHAEDEYDSMDESTTEYESATD